MGGTYAEAPQDIKDAVESLIRTYGGDPALLAGALVASMSRAIMAATAAEREACERVALDIAASYGNAASALPSDHYKVPYRLHRQNAATEVGSAIRNRGEA